MMRSHRFLRTLSIFALAMVIANALVTVHMIGRASYLDRDVSLWPRAHTDHFSDYAATRRAVTRVRPD